MDSKQDDADYPGLPEAQLPSAPAAAPLPRELYSEPLPPAAPPALPHSLRRAPPTAALPPPHNLEKGSTIPSDSMPADLRNQLIDLEEWAQANRRDAIQDGVGFWSLKIPAIIASSSAGLWAHFGLTTVSVVAGAVASLCVIIDGIHPRGMLRNTHLKAYHDIRILLTHMVTEWRSRNSNAKEDNIARRIIRDAEAERQRIAAYIRDAETALRHEDKA